MEVKESYFRDNIVDWCKEIGWNFIDNETANTYRDRKLNSAILKKVFYNCIKNFNSNISDRIIDNVFHHIEGVFPNIKGNKDVWEYLKGIKTYNCDIENREKSLKIIDFNVVENNEFHIAKEYAFKDQETNTASRIDIMFFVNGIPVVMVEAEPPSRVDGIEVGFGDIVKYHNYACNLTKVVQIYTITNLWEKVYNVTWNLNKRNFVRYKPTFEDDLKQVFQNFFAKENILRMIKDFVVFRVYQGEISKTILKPHQIVASYRIEERFKSNKNRGLIWHTQGSGKTLTMLITAKRLWENSLFESPTILVVVDRVELQEQIEQNIETLNLNTFMPVYYVENSEQLKELLVKDMRGMIVVIIHKFRDITIPYNDRKNICVFIDEAHRSTRGLLGTNLFASLPNATVIGFTGTPIDTVCQGKSTFQIFGDDDEDRYLHKYGIKESIKDGTTIQLYYMSASADLQIDKKVLEEEFLNVKEAQGMLDVDTCNRIIEKSNILKAMLMSEDRIEKVAKFISNHYRDYIEPMGYKAMVVAVNRETCVKYKKALDRYLPPEYSCVVISQNEEDKQKRSELTKFYLSEKEEETKKKDFRFKDKMPKIFIVTDKLLTGYDAPILQCMYLDKPMRDHVLLQAIARVNRPYVDENGIEKQNGLIVDFVNLLPDIEKALHFDSKDIENIVINVEELKEEFKNLINELSPYLEIYQYKKESNVFHTKILNTFGRNEGVKSSFYDKCKRLANLYNTISPDPFLSEYIDTFRRLQELYIDVKEAVEKDTVKINKEFSAKVKQIVAQATKSTEVESSQEVVEIMDKIIATTQNNRNEGAVLEAYVQIKQLVSKLEQEASPKYVNFVSFLKEKIDLLLEKFKKQKIETEEILSLFKNKIQEFKENYLEQSEQTGDFLIVDYILKENNVPNSQEKASFIIQKLNSDEYKFWKEDPQKERQLRIDLEVMLSDENVDLGVISDALVSILQELKRQ